MGRLRWTVVFDPPRDGAANMAVDHALAETADPDAGWLRLYRWTRPTLSLGRNEPAAGFYDFERAGRLGIDVVRRPTGGRGVLHDAELTYAVVAPVAAGGLRAPTWWCSAAWPPRCAPWGRTPGWPRACYRVRRGRAPAST